MNRFVYAACVGLICVSTRFARAHGTPIMVSGANNTFTVSNGFSDAEGFAPQIFVEDDEEGDPFAQLELPSVGPVILWQIPGFNISDMANSGSLSIEVMARPVRDSNPLDVRTLWYWNSSPASETVEPATSDFSLLGTGGRYLTLTPDDNVAPPPFLLAQTLTGQQNFHNHGLLSYALEDSSSTADGVYGFFARLISSQYGPSDPFLIVVNYGADYEQMLGAALAINAAAVETLPGDYNHDDQVDAADYVVWSKRLPTDGNYSTWQTNFGRTLNGGAGSSTLAASAAAPEPSTILLLTIAIAGIARRHGRCA